MVYRPSFYSLLANIQHLLLTVKGIKRGVSIGLRSTFNIADSLIVRTLPISWRIDSAKAFGASPGSGFVAVLRKATKTSKSMTIYSYPE